MQNFISRALVFLLLVNLAKAQTMGRETILIETAYGHMKIKLFKETPLHRANFIKLVKEGYFDSLLFHRVINQFMIQGGDHLSKHAQPGDSLGHGERGAWIPAEFHPTIYHQKGRLCAARENDDINPKKESSPTQFYIVMGKKRSLEDLKKYEDRFNKQHYNHCAREFAKTDDGKRLKQTHERLLAENKTDSATIINAKIEAAVTAEHLKTPPYKFNAEQIKLYTEQGGTPHLDHNYTVFGQVIEGLEVIDKIAAVKTDKRDRPLEDIRMKVSLIK